MVNKVILVGRLGTEPELKTGAAGSVVLKFRLATDERYVTKDGVKTERTEWHNLVLFGRFAETYATFLRKGSLIYAEGSIRSDSWDDKTTGEKKYRTEIVVDQLRMLDKKGE